MRKRYRPWFRGILHPAYAQLLASEQDAERLVLMAELGTFEIKQTLFRELAQELIEDLAQHIALISTHNQTIH